MSTKFHVFKGKVKWAQNLVEPDEYLGNRFWRCNLYDLDEESIREFELSGIQVRPKEDNDGDTLYRFKRPCSKNIKGEVVDFEPPKLVDTEENEITYKLANGSKIEAGVASYDTVMGKGHRLIYVKVVEGIPYESPDDSEENLREMFRQ